VDVPNVDILCYGRVTHSRTIFLQQLGRGLRLKPDKKRKLLVLDYVDDLRRIGAVRRMADEFREENDDGIELLKLETGFKLAFNDENTKNFIELVEPDATELDEEDDVNRLITIL
jgi:superfamily II DNA or RNA helicase